MEISRERRKQVKEYYLQEECVERMVSVAENREFAPTYPNGYGSRPDAISFAEDFRSFVRKGAIAFHGSVEKWRNPLLIGKMDMEKIRSGWDLVIDIDADEGMGFAKAAAEEIVKEFRDHGISDESISVKFSGNRGFHIGVRGEAFPSRIGGSDFASLYPRLPQAIVNYLRDRIEDRLAERILAIDDRFEDVVEEDGPFAVADVENNWGQRHLFRMPFSVNEKSWLVSLPIGIDEIESFEKPDAAIERVDFEYGFLDSFVEGEAVDLAVEAIDWASSHAEPEDDARKTKGEDYELPENALAKEYFPPPITKIYNGLDDGRKRGLFILITFLRHVGYGWEEIEKEIWDWNDRNKEPLDETYVKTQLNWHMNQDRALMPPNFGGKGWYRDIGVIDDDEDKQMLENFDNPVPYAYVLRKKKQNSDEE